MTEPPEDSDADLAVRAAPGQRRRISWFPLCLGVAGVASGLLISRGDARFLTLGSALLAGVSCYGVFQWAGPRTGFEFTQGRIWYRGWLARRREIFQESAPGKIIEIPVLFAGGARPAKWWILVAEDGAPAAAFYAEMFDRDDLTMLRKRLDIPVEQLADPIPAEAVEAQFPGALPWWLVHFLWILGGVVGVIFAAVALFMTIG